MSKEFKSDFVGRLFVNTTKDGKVYLRGTIGGVKYVGFMTEKENDKGELVKSFGIKKDERKEGGTTTTSTIKKPKAPF